MCRTRSNPLVVRTLVTTLLLVGFCVPTSKAQPWSKAPQIGEFVVEAYVDSQGNLWLGTMGKGAARWDGEHLTYFNQQSGLAGNTVASIREDQEGNIWFGTHSGATKYDGVKFDSFREPEGLHGEGCNILVTKDGAIWAGTNHGAFRLEGKRFREISLPAPDLDTDSFKWEKGKVWCLMQDRQGNLWFGRDGLGACKLDGDKVTHFTKNDGLPSNNVSQIVEDKQGNIWFGTLTSDLPKEDRKGGLARYDGKQITSFPEIPGLSRNDIYTLFVSREGDVWIGATGVGAYRYRTDRFELFDRTNRKDLTVNFGLQSVAQDRDGELWFGFSGGLFRFDGKTFINVTTAGPWK